MSVITVGGKAYASHEVEVHFLGRLNRGVLEVEWDSKEDSADVYTIGSKDPVDSIESNRAHTGSLTILHDELLGLEVAADGTVLDVKPFDITVVYKKAPLFHKQTLYSFKALGRGQAIKAGDNGALAWKIPGRFQAVSPLKPL
jgi:hypothetical protein